MRARLVGEFGTGSKDLTPELADDGRASRDLERIGDQVGTGVKV